jgi:hypothetical protein
MVSLSANPTYAVATGAFQSPLSSKVDDNSLLAPLSVAYFDSATHARVLKAKQFLE